MNYQRFCLILVTATAIHRIETPNPLSYLSPPSRVHNVEFFSTNAIAEAVEELQRTNPELKTLDIINYAPILVVLKEYFRNGFSGRSGLELGIEPETMNLFRYLQKKGCQMHGVGYNAPGNEGFSSEEISDYLRKTEGSELFDFIYARKVLTTISSLRNSLQRLLEIYKGIHSNLKDGGYLIALDEFSEIIHGEMSLPTETIVNLGFEIIDEFYLSLSFSHFASS